MTIAIFLNALGAGIILAAIIGVIIVRSEKYRNKENEIFLRTLIESSALTKTAYHNIKDAFEDCGTFKGTPEYKRLWTDFQIKYREFSPYKI